MFSRHPTTLFLWSNLQKKNKKTMSSILVERRHRKHSRESQDEISVIYDNETVADTKSIYCMSTNLQTERLA